jgi:hypothetical protein
MRLDRIAITANALTTFFLASGCSAVVSLLVFSCGGNQVGTDAYLVRDSAGIRIVENHLPSWTTAEVWRVDTKAILDVSGRDDPGLLSLTDPFILPDGGLVLFDEGNCQVRFYDEDWQLSATSGRCGAGPGEYGSGGEWMLPFGADSLLVFDWNLQRITVLGFDGGVGHIQRIPTHIDMPRPRVRGSFSNKTLVLSGQRNPTSRDPGVVETTDHTVSFLPSLDDTVRLIDTYPGSTFIFRESQGRLARSVLPFSGSTKIAVGPDWLDLGFPDRFEIQRLSEDGSIDCIIRRTFQTVAVTSGDIAWLLGRALAKVEGTEARRRTRQRYRDLQHAKTMPAFGTPRFTAGEEAGGPDMLIDIEGYLWVFEYYRPGEYRNQFSVFSREGVWQGSVVLPNGFEPSQIGKDFILGTWTDELGFAHARRYGLIKP